ncbi:hypothetical protein FPQ18DRAFT_119868 [Pyronema domesticum]|uniref:Similar to Presenilins-associated rhomboid-like protein, mitochondrial acc. no. Q3B8P0 n=1 Tax=Pyronema omphalodes (strain CBS 100304) TaxID=1076935 RepID=U4LVW8_PYROM|nr:hypothetical protein FPQ18DRAFT_119868 [Pyronema domesticum]CCX32896.1 Similar to Presenilins-associated rhomboid-like protein, mitochondrial; acc. no. Q3B8P0 [Pyronema omphalodes CBS 100304]
MLHLTTTRLLTRSLAVAARRPLLSAIPRRTPVASTVQQHVRSLRNRPTAKATQTTPPPPPATINETSDVIPEPTEPSFRERVWMAGQLSDITEPPVMSWSQRLLRPALFTLFVVGGSIAYAYTYQPTKQSERWFPTVPIAFATVSSIIAINCAVFVAWKIPLPITWRVLNRYFVSVPAIPYSASMLGNAFSHQTLMHLGVNMFVLYSLGTTLCEQIGAGSFLGLYMSGGVVSSFASLAYNVARQRFSVISLGASGAISSVVAAYAYLNPDNQLYIIFLPFLALKAGLVVKLMACLEAVGIARGWKKLDHVAHLSGLGWGTVGAWAIVKEYERRLEAKRQERKEKGWNVW